MNHNDLQRIKQASIEALEDVKALSGRRMTLEELQAYREDFVKRALELYEAKQAWDETNKAKAEDCITLAGSRAR